jgi:hypothetical protein
VPRDVEAQWVFRILTGYRRFRIVGAAEGVHLPGLDPVGEHIRRGPVHQLRPWTDVAELPEPLSADEGTRRSTR